MEEAAARLRILVHSRYDASSIRDSLGLSDYSYHFVLEAFRPMLAECGEVVRVEDAQKDIPALIAAARSQGVDCVYLSFAPPNLIEIPQDCPAAPVFAWEFATLPESAFCDDWRNDWVEVLRRCGQAITHSGFAAELVRERLGADFPVAVIPAPVWDAYAPLRDDQRTASAVRARELLLDCMILDSRCLESDVAAVVPRLADRGDLPPASGRRWDGSEARFRFGDSRSRETLLVGFHAEESWGVWSREDRAWIQLPWAIEGGALVRLRAAAFGGNAGRRLSLRIGEQLHHFEPGAEPTDFDFECRLQRPDNVIMFEGMLPERPSEGGDPRALGLALHEISIRRREDEETQPEEAQPGSVLPLRLDECVYVAIFNPKDGRKNWQDIVTAFCLAFRERSQAALILKMTHHDVSRYIDEVFLLFRKLAPFACRVVVLHGYLDGEAYRQLTSVADFIVSASAGEGQCLPLMEYMSAGVPAIAPRNTAMRDYIDADSAFIVESSAEPTYFPHDPRQVLGTLRQRISWQSLYDAFLRSFDIRMHDLPRYSVMASAASRAQHEFCSRERLSPRLAQFLRQMRTQAGNTP